MCTSIRGLRFLTLLPKLKGKLVIAVRCINRYFSSELICMYHANYYVPEDEALIQYAPSA